mmetsp:Transcript_8819/g.13595  ORF Transcript_8819/g.13595 Transcript_8819/m.13595 type:complete len:259 (-) Transcript_8819:147-923(-)|eukprot:CAMPEP_0170512792 /NCGR_PEP_ID=MMETSP0208-20121228/67045_1 /TAXON_ID=197538 /ORGANISM="Strombidium inclinatum, Strain S3" /LENGTH=258 /DNA_ID=CAMNT_0010796457 /DNA_START=804 /DNA_END=1580 /DNA_ORIENTATION=+
MTNEDYNLYFFDIKKGKALQQLLNETGQVLRDDQQLFKFWAKELLFAFKDITYKSTYTIKGDITLRNMYISDLGIKVYLKKIKFGELRDETIDFHLQVEAKMLNNFAKILIEMLSLDYKCGFNDYAIDDILYALDIDPELKAIIYECLHAKDKIAEKEQETYDNEINSFIHQERALKQKEDKEASSQDTEMFDEFHDLLEFKRQNEQQAKEDEVEKKITRTISRKSVNPKANRKNYEQENSDFGVATEVDLVLQRIAG